MNKEEKTVKELSLKFIITAAMFLAAVFLFAFLAHEVVLENEDLFDSRVFTFLHAHTTPGVVNLMRVITFFGSSSFLFPAYALLLLILLLRKNRRWAIN